MTERTQSIFQSRIEVIDVLRGFALVGILYAHMVIWYTGASLPQEVYLKYDSFPDNVAMAIFGALVLGKFFSVFSFLFGLGFYLQFRKKGFGWRTSGSYTWRLSLLFLIGIAHHILWRGDILAIYAVLGVLLLGFRQLPDKLILGIAFLLILNVPTHLYELLDARPPTSEVGLPMAGEAEAYYHLVKNGNFPTVLEENWKSWPAKLAYQLESGRLLMTFGYFLLGLYAGRKNLFSSINKNLRKFKVWNEVTKYAVLSLLLVGLLMYLFDFVSLPDIEIVPFLKWPASVLFSIYNACLTIFYITGISLMFQKRLFRRYLKPLASMGRMALTNYLLQTFFGLLIFYDFALGLFDRTSPAENVILGIFVFLIQLKVSQMWLKYFRQGPMEWLWRGLTYFRFPMNRKPVMRWQLQLKWQIPIVRPH